MDDKQAPPKPPSQADLDQLSRDQGLIADEWAPDQHDDASTVVPDKKP